MSPKTGTRQQANRLATRRAILDAAYDLFEEKGYEQATMRLLAQRAGVGQGTIFKHFADKSQLLLAAYKEDANGLWLAAFEDMPSKDLKDQVVHLTRAAFGFYASRPRLGRILLKEGLFLEKDAAELDLQGFEDLWPKMLALITSAQKRGEVSPGADPAQILEAFFSFYIYVLIVALREERFDVESSLKTLSGLVEMLLSQVRA